MSSIFTRFLRGPFLAALAALTTVTAPAHAADINLEPVKSFLVLPDDVTLGPCSAVAVNRAGEIFLFHRGTRPILCFDPAGKLLRSWGDDLITNVKGAHGIRVDRDENVWVTDIAAHRVYRFDPQGKLTLSLGTGKPGDALDQFNKPTDIAFGPKDEVYITDGYGNNRVLKYSNSGKLLASWGKAGKGEGEFHLPHSVVVDGRGRVIVGDRENDRVQLFDGDGKFLAVWNGYAPYGLALSPDGELFVADARAEKVLRLDENGKVIQSWGGKGTEPGQFQTPHMLSFDAAGNLFVAEVTGQRLQKFTRKK